MQGNLKIGIDIGGTFTDFVVYDSASRGVETFKVLSTPNDPAIAVLKGLKRALARKKAPSVSVIHGSTVATNALLERKGARTALVATAGFKDVLQIGRQNRPALYDFFANPPPPLVPSDLRFELDERVDRDGQVLRPLMAAQIDDVVEQIKAHRAESVAVCLLFSFARPDHEQIITEKLRAAGLLVSPSCEILPEFREYERASTTAVNAYVSPILEHYLSRLEEALIPAPNSSMELGNRVRVNLRVMQSNGGNISPAEARRFGVRCILSGPAGGVVGSEYLARLALAASAGSALRKPERFRVITFDMGGTSTDVSLIEGKPQLTTESSIGGCPICIPVLDIHTIGAGGGSIAAVDVGGALRVGPESAGAEPGPACYGRGTRPTVTDANLVLGRLAPEHFLGGEMRLDPDRAHGALSRLGIELKLSAEQAALGVVQIANAHMEHALRVISVERGHDPRDFMLLSFGGAGGLHAAELARGLGIPLVLVPPLASTLSAFGMLAADVVKDYTRTVMLPGDTAFEVVEKQLAHLTGRGNREVLGEGIPADCIRLESSLDMRYTGQSYELAVPFAQGFEATFHGIHKKVYGYARPGARTEIVNLRARATGQIDPPSIQPQPLGGEDAGAALLETRPVIFADGPRPATFFRAEALHPGNLISGPAIVVRADTTVLIGPSDVARVDGFGNILIDVSMS